MHHELHRSDTKIARMTTKQCKKKKGRAAGQKKCELTIFVGHNAALVSGDQFLKVYWMCEVAKSKKYLKLRSTAPCSSHHNDIEAESAVALIFTMPTELPYAADAEMSLTFDELEVCFFLFNPRFALESLHIRSCVCSTRRNCRKTTSLRKQSLITRGGLSRVLYMTTRSRA